MWTKMIIYNSVFRAVTNIVRILVQCCRAQTKILERIDIRHGFFGDKKVFKLMFEQQGLFCEKPAGPDGNFSNRKSPVKAWRQHRNLLIKFFILQLAFARFV